MLRQLSVSLSLTLPDSTNEKDTWWRLEVSKVQGNAWCFYSIPVHQ